METIQSSSIFHLSSSFEISSWSTAWLPHLGRLQGQSVARITMGKSHLQHFVLTTLNKWLLSGAQKIMIHHTLGLCDGMLWHLWIYAHHSFKRSPGKDECSVVVHGHLWTSTITAGDLSPFRRGNLRPGLSRAVFDGLERHSVPNLITACDSCGTFQNSTMEPISLQTDVYSFWVEESSGPCGRNLKVFCLMHWFARRHLQDSSYVGSASELGTPTANRERPAPSSPPGRVCNSHGSLVPVHLEFAWAKNGLSSSMTSSIKNKSTYSLDPANSKDPFMGHEQSVTSRKWL